MVRVTVLSPNAPGSRFDMDYYVREHCPMVMERLGAACKGFGVEEGAAGIMPPGKAAYRTTAWFLFDSMESFQAAFGPHAEEITGDIPNYTDLQPVIQAGVVRA